MRLLTYNIHYWAGSRRTLNLPHLIEILRKTQADIIGLNEVLHPLYTPQGPRYPLLELAQALDMHWAFGPSFEQRATRFWPGVLGNAVLSRFPIRQITNTPLRSLPTRKRRTLFHVTLDIHGHPFVVFVTHLDHLLAAARRRQFETIVTHLHRVREPHVLLGDFNTHTPIASRWWKGELVIRQLRALGYEDAYALVGRDGGRSYPARFPFVRLDYIWVPKEWAHAVRAACVVECPTARRASDHLPVCVDWWWDILPHVGMSRTQHEIAS